MTSGRVGAGKRLREYAFALRIVRGGAGVITGNAAAVSDSGLYRIALLSTVEAMLAPRIIGGYPLRPRLRAPSTFRHRAVALPCALQPCGKAWPVMASETCSRNCQEHRRIVFLPAGARSVWACRWQRKGSALGSKVGPMPLLHEQITTASQLILSLPSNRLPSQPLAKSSPS